MEDEWGRRTSAAFDIPTASVVFQSFYDEFEDDVFFVSSRTDRYYYRRDCPEVCGIPQAERIYFLSAENAETAGKRRSPSCFGY